MDKSRRSKILYPFRCETVMPDGRTGRVNMYARNRRTAKRLAFKYFYKTFNHMFSGDARAYHMPNKPLAIPVKE